MKPRPKAAVGVILRKDGKVLMGKRKNSHGAGEWAFPSGHLEYHETPEQAAVREVDEETGLAITNLKRFAFTNDIFPGEDMHYVTLFLIADYAGGEAQNREPEKCEGWEWFAWDNMPRPVFQGIEHLLEQKLDPMKL